MQNIFFKLELVIWWGRAKLLGKNALADGEPSPQQELLECVAQQLHQPAAALVKVLGENRAGRPAFAFWKLFAEHCW